MKKYVAFLCLIISTYGCQKANQQPVSQVPGNKAFTIAYDTTFIGLGNDERVISFPQFNAGNLVMDSANIVFDVKVKGAFTLSNPGNLMDSTDSVSMLRTDDFQMLGNTYAPYSLTFISMANLSPSQQKIFVGEGQHIYRYTITDSLVMGTGNFELKYTPGTWLQLSNEILPYELSDISNQVTDTVKVSLIFSVKQKDL